MIEIPHGAEREYFRAFGIVALFIAASPARMPCLIGYTHDLGSSLESIRGRWHWSIEISEAWWVAQHDDARQVINRASACFPADDRGRLDVECGALAERMVREAKAAGVVLTAHGEALQRVRMAVAHVDAMIASANESGGLRWFNRAYRDWRMTASADMAAALPYALARSRLRAALVRRFAGGEPAIDQAGLSSEIFPGAVPGRPGQDAANDLPPYGDGWAADKRMGGLPSPNGRHPSQGTTGAATRCERRRTLTNSGCDNGQHFLDKRRSEGV